MNKPHPKSAQGRIWSRHCISAAVAAAFGVAVPDAGAFEFDTGNPDVSVRWDNTGRFNYATRVEGRDSKIGNSPLADEGDYSFDKGDAVATRFDLLSEMDVVYRKVHGIRLSGAAWYDAAYGDKSRSNPNPPLVNIPSYVNHDYSSYTKRYYAGPSGELLDAFAFTRLDLGPVPTAIKFGRHSIYWGESLLLNGNLHSVAYAQNPLDLQKAYATPGTEAKELFRPLNQVSVQAQVTDSISVAAQYMLQWESFRYPEGGTYLGPVDFAFNGPDRQFISPALGFATRGDPVEPHQSGDWGLATRFSPEWLDGTFGVYYRKFSDKLPQTFLTQVGPNVSRYNLIYADDIDLYGVSFAKNIAGISLGSELSYRHNTPLNSQVLGIAPGLPEQGDTKGPRGNTYHGLVNGVGQIAKTPVFDSAVYAVELTWSQWAQVTSGQNLFYAEGFAPCNGRDKWDGCTTKNYYGLGFSFSPTWYQVFPGVDLSAPLTYSQGLYGNAATVFGGNQASGNYTVGVGADIVQKYRVDLKYIDFLGRYRDNGTAVTTQNGFNTLVRDRGFISLTLKATL